MKRVVELQQTTDDARTYDRTKRRTDWKCSRCPPHRVENGSAKRRRGRKPRKWWR